MRVHPALPVLLLTGLLTACAGKQPLHITHYSFTVPAIEAAPAPKFNVIFVRDYYVNPAYEDKLFDYRTGELTYESDFYHQYALFPHTQFTTLTRIILQKSGLFKKVLLPGSAQLSDYVLESNVAELYADFRDPRQPVTRLTISFHLVYHPPGKSGAHPTWFKQTYTQVIPLRRRTAAEVAAAWNTAYTNIMLNLVRDLAGLTLPPPDADAETGLTTDGH
ncbi:MAG: hypothetical protein LBK76_09310 [Verrucomicrobiales bacterium]|jgi:hypothetical protein|nr:hypothetical protein [Verrucomicrobiales bacterium]